MEYYKLKLFKENNASNKINGDENKLKSYKKRFKINVQKNILVRLKWSKIILIKIWI